MEHKRILYDFCPRCSGLMKNGVCIACGYEKKPETVSAQQESVPGAAKTDALGAFPGGAPVPGSQAGGSHMGGSGSDLSGGSRPGGNGAQTGGSGFGTDGMRPAQDLNALQTPKRKKHTGIIALLCGIVLAFVLIFALAVSLIATDVRKNSSQSRTSSQTTDSSEDTYAEYVPDASDEYYVEIVDYLRNDLSYQVEWQEYEVENEDAATSYYALFPVLTGEVPNLEELNGAIEDAARKEEIFCQYAAEDEDVESCSIYKEGYVTYMDEDVVSVVFREYIYLNGAYLPRISDINIDVRTGSVLKHGSMVDYSTALAQRVRKQNAYQNSVDIENMPWSDEDIAALLQSEEGVAFYTPVGLEVGFNYSSSDTGYGWLTVTLKDYGQH